MVDPSSPSCPRCDLPLAGDPGSSAGLSCPEPYCDFELVLPAPRPQVAAIEAPAPLPPPWLRLAG